MLTFNKPKLIRKSDFFGYFIMPRDQWFYKPTHLIEYIKNKTSDLQIDVDELESDDENYDSDSLELLRLAILNNESIDQRDPKIFEGLLIDKQSREFIKMKYINLKSIDFDEVYQGINDFNYLANETKKYLLKDNFLLLQPVFIYKNKAVVRPDALVKEKGRYTLIEVKGTCKPKVKHLVDLIYQHHIINDTLQATKNMINNYLLCLVKYTKGIKNKINYELVEHIPLVKTGRDWPESIKNKYLGLLKYSDDAIEARRVAFLDIGSNIFINNLILDTVSQWNDKKKLKMFETFIKPLLDANYFENIINELQSHINRGEPSLLPEFMNLPTWFANYPFSKEITKYYFNNQKFLSFQWSRKIINHKLQYQAYIEHEDIDEQTLQKFMIKIDLTNARWFKDFQASNYTCFAGGVFRTAPTKELFAQLKLNKVYFDFESINPATCVVDDTAPYTQVVTQVSIIKNNDNSINIVIDPQKITVDDFRKIIDLIFNGNDCSYVVYNKSFECTRLTEMAALINDETYTQKVTDIKNNIFDLADFFKPSRTNDLITIHELRGFYSIKNVLPIVQKYAPEICQKVGVKKYDELEGIHRGDEALNQTSRRFFNLLNDKEWQQITTQLQQYCENDVRAMIAIELYVKYIIS